MTDHIKELKKNGLLLKTIPSKERTDEQCLVAVRQNPKALRFVPCKLQTEKLCKTALKKDPSVIMMISYRAINDKLRIFAVRQNGMMLQFIEKPHRTEKICRTALAGTIEALQFVPTNIREEIYQKASEELVHDCLAWIRDDIAALEFLPLSVITSRLFMDYYKKQGSLSVIGSCYNSNIQAFLVKVEYELEDEHERHRERLAMASFADFMEYYDFLDGNLDGALLRTFRFDGIDLHNINIAGAVIHSDVLVSQGLYDGAYYEERFGKTNEESLVEANELALAEDFQYSRPVEDEGNSMLRADQFPVFYVSDIHLWHRIKHRLKERGTKEETHDLIRRIVRDMVSSVGTIPYKSFLLVAGDVSDQFEFTEVFYRELIKLWEPDRIVVVSGNHELWDPPVNMEDNIRIHREFFTSLGIIYLQNDLFCVDDSALPRTLSEDEIMKMPENEIHEIVCRCPLLIFGGIGFSGLNEKYNAVNMRYGPSFDTLPRDEARKKDIAESVRFASIYQKLTKALSGKRMVVLTHMRKEDWTGEPYIPLWSYVNGHNHRNYYEVNDQKKVYADNQIGYHKEKVGLKHFYTENEYDIFSYYNDGIYQISKAQYIDFNRGKLIMATFNRSATNITMLKKRGYYMFLYYGKYSVTAKNEYLYLLNGGSLVYLRHNSKEDAEYYYNQMERYIENIHKLLYRYTGIQKSLSQFVKKLGGSGKIHGCIIDVDQPAYPGGFSYTHLFVNPIDGTVTPYFAWDVKSRIIYKDFQSLLENQNVCERLLTNYKKLSTKQLKDLPVINLGTDIAEWGEDDSVYDEGGYLYKMSRIIRSLQYCTEKNVIRNWNENLLNHEFVERVMISDKAEGVMDDGLIF